MKKNSSSSENEKDTIHNVQIKTAMYLFLSDVIYVINKTLYCVIQYFFLCPFFLSFLFVLFQQLNF